MKILHTLGFVLQIVDAFSGVPLGDALVASEFPCKVFKKEKGIFLISQTGKLAITHLGYIGEVVDLQENVMIGLNYSPDNPKLRVIKYLPIITQPQSSVNIKINKKIPVLRVVEGTKKDDTEISLNCNKYMPFFCMGFENKSQTIHFKGYNDETNRYILESPLLEDIKSGDFLKPLWTIKSDSKGNAIFPLDNFLISSDITIIEINGKEVNL